MLAAATLEAVARGLFSILSACSKISPKLFPLTLLLLLIVIIHQMLRQTL